MSILTVAYISDAVNSYSDKEMTDLLEVCRRNNKELDITGMLIYAGDKFLQILEGDPEVIESLLAKIELDTRHNHLVVMDTTLSEKRHFAEWSMGYQRTSAGKVAEVMDGYIDVFEGNKLIFDKQLVRNINVNVILEAFKRIVQRVPA